MSTKSTEPETAHAQAADAGDRGRDLEEGRKHYGARAWAKAYHALDRADRAAPLERERVARRERFVRLVAELLLEDDARAVEPGAPLATGEPLRVVADVEGGVEDAQRHGGEDTVPRC